MVTGVSSALCKPGAGALGSKVKLKFELGIVVVGGGSGEGGRAESLGCTVQHPGGPRARRDVWSPGMSHEGSSEVAQDHCAVSEPSPRSDPSKGPRVMGQQQA